MGPLARNCPIPRTLHNRDEPPQSHRDPPGLFVINITNFFWSYMLPDPGIAEHVFVARRCYNNL
jgi:hypothetical protein